MNQQSLKIYFIDISTEVDSNLACGLHCMAAGPSCSAFRIADDLSGCEIGNILKTQTQ